ncbi:hypothetical protein K7X08_026183 [Anisodus acutangulus]|uniref:Uncharacterized protein n=1 Tax=Anisodus acutangulus TaxID=402998 RepID=A0A9Q1N5R5_9SOLA|nr:hypothetical protein K7X08_026183 [Anisodus acutangulus]
MSKQNNVKEDREKKQNANKGNHQPFKILKSEKHQKTNEKEQEQRQSQDKETETNQMDGETESQDSERTITDVREKENKQKQIGQKSEVQKVYQSMEILETELQAILDTHEGKGKGPAIKPNKEKRENNVTSSEQAEDNNKEMQQRNTTQKGQNNKKLEQQSNTKPQLSDILVSGMNNRELEPILMQKQEEMERGTEVEKSLQMKMITTRWINILQKLIKTQLVKAPIRKRNGAQFHYRTILS